MTARPLPLGNMAKQDAKIEIPEVDLPPRCKAKSRRTGNPCGNRPLDGSTQCRFHGGHLYGKPSAALTHGATSKYVNVALLPEIMERAEKYTTPKGRVAAAVARAAIVEHRAAALPEGAESLDLHLKAMGSIRADVAQMHELEKVDAPPPQAPVFQIANFGDAANGTMLSRTAEGPVTIQLVNGKPYILDEPTGALYPALKKIDKGTGAEIYARVLQLEAPDST